MRILNNGKVDIIKKRAQGVDWTERTQNKVQYFAFKNTLIDLHFSQKQGITK
jgi:hypothetical protein